MKTTKINTWKTADIKLHKDSQGYYEATHPYAGRLIDFDYFPTRGDARRAAVVELRERQEDEENGYDRDAARY